MSFVPATAASYDALDNDFDDDEILKQYRPLILKGLVNNWEITQAGQQSDEALIQYLARFYTGFPLEIWIGPADIDGRFFYSDDMQGFNFERKKAHLPSALKYLFSQNAKTQPQAVYMGATSIAECLPGMDANNQLEIVPDGVSPNIWMGNQVKISCHYDTSNNIACNVHGRRRFTLFPPEEINNLYIGPIDMTPAGQAISLVDINNPDLERFPRYKTAMKSAVVVDLEPGDALFIPPLWWHHVESLDAFNVLVNYWWNTSPLETGSPFDSLIHSILTLTQLPQKERQAWKTLYEHYVFAEENPLAHLKPEDRGALGDLQPEMVKSIRQYLHKRAQS